MKGFLCSQDGAYAFPLGPKVTTVGRENCDISINSPSVDPQHALLEFDSEQRCFILKDLNSTTGTYVHDCRVQNAAVRLADGDGIKFGLNGLPLEFRIEQQTAVQRETSMPSIFPRTQASNQLQVITQTIPSRKPGMNVTNYPQNPGFSLRSRPVSAGTRKSPPTCVNNHFPNDSRDLRPITNAWTTTAVTSNMNRSLINGSFVGEVDVGCPDTSDLTNRVDQLEREVKGRDDEIRHLNDRIRSLEPMGASFSNEVHGLKTELEKVRREKQAASGLVSSLQRDLHSKESNLAKLSREIETLKADSRDKDLRLQSLQGKLNLIRDRSRADEDRNSKERESRIKMHEQQINDLNENINRLKTQLQETEKQLLKLTQNEQKLKQECDELREKYNESQQSESSLKNDLVELQRKHREFCIDIWHCFTSSEENDEYDEDQQNIIQQVQQIQRDLIQTQEDLETEKRVRASNDEELRTKCQQFSEIIINSMHQRTSVRVLQQARQQIEDVDAMAEDDSAIGSLKRTFLHALESQLRLVNSTNELLITPVESPDDSTIDEMLALLRRQYEDFENEKQRLIADFIEKEKTIRFETMRLGEEKDSTWQERLNAECDRIRLENDNLRDEHNSTTRLFSERIEKLNAENEEYLARYNSLQDRSTRRIDELTSQNQSYEEQLSQQREHSQELARINTEQAEQMARTEGEMRSTIDDLNGQIKVLNDQVKQFSLTIVHLEKKYEEEHDRFVRLQTDFESLNKMTRSSAPSPVVETSVPMMPVMPVLTAPVADLNQELFAYKSRVQEQEQIIISLRSDLAGMAARLSDVRGELSDKQKRSLEKCETTIQDQAKELGETRLKLSKLSEIVDKQTQHIEALTSDLAKSKVLNDEYRMLVDKRQTEINQLNQMLEERNLTVARVEKHNEEEGRITHELVAIGAQCKGERHEQTIGRQREALNELRARIKSLEQLRPANPSYEKVLQQVVLLKRELAELRAKQALPTDIPNLTAASNFAASAHQSSSRSAGTIRQSPSGSFLSDPNVEAQKVLEERASHAETMNCLQSCDDLYNTFTRKLVQILDIDDDSLLNAAPLASMPIPDRYVALQQRQRATEILMQKIEMLRERLSRKEDLLRDYEKDLGRLRQAEILLREKDNLLQDLEADKRTKDDEAFFLRNTLKETQDTLNSEKRLNSSIKLGRNPDAAQSNDLIRRSGGSTLTLHHHCPPDASGKVRVIKRNMNEKISRKDYEIKSLKQELNQALDKISDQAHQVKLLEIRSKHQATHEETN